MQEFIIDMMNQFGYWAILLLIAVENIFPPIPSEVILTFGGVMTTMTDMSIPGVILFSTIGSLLGAIVLYGVGRWLNADRLERWVNGKVGRLLHFKAEDIKKAEKWFDRRGKITVLLCRCIPVVRSLISIPAGMAKMNLPIFLLLTTIGSAVWNTVLVLLGHGAGSQWDVIVGYVDKYATVTVVVLALACIGAVIFFYRKRLSKKAREMEKNSDQEDTADK